MMYDLKDLHDGKRIHCPYCEGSGGDYFHAMDGSGADTWIKCVFCNGYGMMVIRLEEMGKEKD